MVILYIYASGMPAALAAAFSWSVVASVQADAAVGTEREGNQVGAVVRQRPQLLGQYDCAVGSLQ